MSNITRNFPPGRFSANKNFDPELAPDGDGMMRVQSRASTAKKRGLEPALPPYAQYFLLVISICMLTFAITHHTGDNGCHDGNIGYFKWLTAEAASTIILLAMDIITTFGFQGDDGIEDQQTRAHSSMRDACRFCSLLVIMMAKMFWFFIGAALFFDQDVVGDSKQGWNAGLPLSCLKMRALGYAYIYFLVSGTAVSITLGILGVVFGGCFNNDGEEECKRLGDGAGTTRARSDSKMSGHSGLSGDEPVIQGGNCTVAQTTANFVNFMLGSATLSLPFIFASGGWYSAIPLAYIAVITLTTGHMLLQCIEETDATSYSALVLKSLGRYGQMILLFTQFIELFFWAVCFVITMGQNMASIFPRYSDKMWMAILCIVALPGVWTNDYRILSKLSTVGLAAFMITMVILYFDCLETIADTHPRDPSSSTKVFDKSKIFAAYGMLLACFSGHAVMPSQRAGMAEPKKFSNVLNSSYFIILATYTSIGAIGYIAYGGTVTSIVTLKLTGRAATVSQACLVTCMVCKLGLALNPLAKEIQVMLGGETADGEKSREEKKGGSGYQWKDILLRSTLLLMAWGAAVSLPNFGFVVGLIGALLATVIVIMIPVSCHLALFSGTKKTGCLGKAMKWFVLMCSPLLAFAALYQLVMNGMSG